MRAEKSANLIYNGGKAKKPAKEAEVSIFFDNSKGTFPSPEAEIKLTRIVRHSGQSIYKINDKTRTRQQILDLMALSKIDPEGYNIILQGYIVRLCIRFLKTRGYSDIDVLAINPITQKIILGEVKGYGINKKTIDQWMLGLLDELSG